MLLPYQLTDKDLKAAQKMIEEMAQLDKSKKQQRLEAQHTTVLRDKAVKKIHVWVSNFRYVTRARNQNGDNMGILINL